MSGTFQIGQIFSGGTIALGQTGQLAFTQTGSVDFSSGGTPSITDIVITKDVLASSQTFAGFITVQNAVITGVHPGTVVSLTTNDLPPGVSLPPGFILPQNVIGTVLDVTVNTTVGPATGSVAVLGGDGSLELVGHVNLVAFGQTLNVGAAILSFGPQTTGSGLNEVFTPQFSAACFASGTRIRTALGEVAVEDLREGDRVQSCFGGEIAVQWIGHRRVDCRRHPKPQDVWPIRVQAGAFGPAQPMRDLMLSPDHAVFEGGALIPIRYLVNGASISQVESDEVTYWHVELPAHDVLLAEGLSCESYLDTGNRAAFANGGGGVMAHPQFARETWDSRGCAPLAVDGPVVQAARTRLLARAALLGHGLTDDPALHVVAAGRRLELRRNGDVLSCELPAGTDRIQLVSRSTVPAWAGASDDHRRLGVAIAGLTLDGLDLAGTARQTGWHAPEAGWQWTDGAAWLDAGPGRLEITLAIGGEYWTGEQRHKARAA